MVCKKNLQIMKEQRDQQRKAPALVPTQMEKNNTNTNNIIHPLQLKTRYHFNNIQCVEERTITCKYYTPWIKIQKKYPPIHPRWCLLNGGEFVG